MRRLTHPVNIATALALSVALVAYIALNSPIFQNTCELRLTLLRRWRATRPRLKLPWRRFRSR